MDAQAELNKLAYEAQYLEAQIQEMQKQLQQMVMINGQMDSTIKTIEGLKEAKNEAYFQIGSGSFIKAKPSGERGILMDVGASVFIDKKPEDAKEVLSKRKKDAERVIEMLKNNIQQIAKRLEEIDVKATELQG